MAPDSSGIPLWKPKGAVKFLLKLTLSRCRRKDGLDFVFPTNDPHLLAILMACFYTEIPITFLSSLYMFIYIAFVFIDLPKKLIISHLSPSENPRQVTSDKIKITTHR